MEGNMSLTNKEASIVLGMAARGDAEHRIAAHFDVNQGRIAEIKGGSYGAIPLAPAIELPPTGSPAVKGRKLRAYALDALKVLRDKGEAGVKEAIKELEDGLKRFESNEN
jgi:hypothetical protein